MTDGFVRWVSGLRVVAGILVVLSVAPIVRAAPVENPLAPVVTTRRQGGRNSTALGRADMARRAVRATAHRGAALAAAGGLTLARGVERRSEDARVPAGAAGP